MTAPPTKPPDDEILFMGSSLKDLTAFPPEAKREAGYALRIAQQGGKHPAAKTLTGDQAFKGSSVLEIVEDDDGGTYRAVYTVKFEGFVYVLHAFQKKSKSGIKTPQRDLDLIKSRLRDAERDYSERRRKSA